MKIYLPGSRGKHTVFVTPGTHHPETTDFFYPDGRARSFTVVFVEGVAKVDSQLGQYMIDRELAQRSPIILPPVIALPQGVQT